MLNLTDEEILAVHKVYYDFGKTFIDEGFAGLPPQYKYSGYVLQREVKKWALEYPNDVHLIPVDDSIHTTSLLCIIEHKTDKTYQGTTIIYIPQNDNGGRPIEIKLGEQAVHDLKEALRLIFYKSDWRKLENWRGSDSMPDERKAKLKPLLTRPMTVDIQEKGEFLTWFDDSPDAGDPFCICSHCLSRIPEGNVPIRFFRDHGNQEMRFHTECFLKAQRENLFLLY